MNASLSERAAAILARLREIQRRADQWDHSALPILVRIGIAEVERAQGKLKLERELWRMHSDWSTRGDDVEARRKSDCAISARIEAEKILNDWSPILEGATPPIAPENR